MPAFGHYLLTGESMDGETAHALGMVSDLVDDPDEVLPAARALAEWVAALPRGGDHHANATRVICRRSFQRCAGTH